MSIEVALMQAQSSRQQKTPHRILLTPLLFALLLFAAQLSHGAGAYFVAFSGAHSAPSASHEHAPQNVASDELNWDQAHHQNAAAPLDSDDHSDIFIVTTHVVRDSHHHHLPCGPDCDVAALTQKTLRHGTDMIALTAFVVPAVPVFLLDARQSLPARAGPTHTRANSVHLTANLLGRAPPLSA